MLGKGLESLIPKKGNPGNRGSDNFSGPNFSNDNSFNSNDTINQEEKEILYDNLNKVADIQKDGIGDNGLNRGRSDDSSDIPSIEGPIFHIEIEKIKLNPYQPRKEFDDNALKELASSIREFGILQPLVVIKVEEENEFGTKVEYQLIAGQRRLMASKLLGLKTVPVVVKNNLKKTEALEMAIVENIQRADLNIIETARAYARLSDEFGLTQREIATRLGKSREGVANALRLLDLPKEIQDAISAGAVNESQARLLMQIEDSLGQKELFSQITRDNLSVRDLRKRINVLKNKEIEGVDYEAPLKAEDMQLKSIEKNLSDFLGAPVKVEFSRSGGKIIINFFSPEEAYGIAQKIRPEDLQ